MLISWSAIHGGPGGNFLCERLFKALAYGMEAVDPKPEDIPNPNMQDKVHKVSLILAREGNQCRIQIDRLSRGRGQEKGVNGRSF